MLISCLLPTYNRPSNPTTIVLLAEAVQCFLLQDYENKELLICNDTPGQSVHFNHPQVRIINLQERFPTLGSKLDFMLKQAQGEYICRWDDDDISLPWRLNYSFRQLMSPAPFRQSPRAEWRPENHWYVTPHEIKETQHPGNTHIMAIWHRDILGGTTYPGRPCASGEEDQTFTWALRQRGYPQLGDLLPLKDIFYMYRWGTGSAHLSGKGGGERMQQHYQEIGEQPVFQRSFDIKPHWRVDYTAMSQKAASIPR